MSPANFPQREPEQARFDRVRALLEGGAENVLPLLDELIEPTWTIRRAVIAALAELGQPAVAPLCRALRSARDNEARIAGIVDALVASKANVDEEVLALTNDGDPAVICDALQVLGRRESARGVPALSRLTLHENDNVALAAVEALGHIGGAEAIEPLLALAGSANFFRAFPAIDALGRSRDSRAIPVLMKLLSDPLYGPEAIRALGRVGDHSALAPLIEQLARANESTVRASAVALCAIHERSISRFGTGVAVERALQGARQLSLLRRQMLGALSRADASEQIALSQALAWIGEESTVPALLGLLDEPGPVAESAVASLKRLSGMAEPALLEALRAGPSARRRLLLPLLAGRLSALDEFVACLEDEDPSVRALACDCLARCGDSSRVAAVFALLADADLRVSQAALAAVQSLGSAETKRLAVHSASSENARVRCAGLRIIGYFAYPEGLNSLLRSASDPDEQVRIAAIGGLPLMDDARAFEAILAALSHSSARTRTTAVRALGQAPQGPRVTQALLAGLGDSDPWVRYYACQGLGKAGDEASTAAIASLLTDGSGQVRVAAVEALAHLRGPRAFEALVSLLDTKDPDLFRAALVGLGISKRQEAFAPLAKAVRAAASTTRLVALSALAELGVPEAIPLIAQAAEDSDPGVRTAAEAFLAGHSHPSATNELVRLLVENPTAESLIQALSRPVPGRVEVIATALLLADDALAVALVSALARAGNEEASATLRRALGAEGDGVRRAAATALVVSGDRLALPALEKAAVHDRDPEVRRICAAFLAQ